MRVGIHQLHYLPWLRYFEKIANSDIFVVLDNVQYNKNGFQNRNRIKGPNGPVMLTVPIVDSFAQPLDAVRINNQTSWRKKHWRSLVQNYSKTPHFADHEAFLRGVYEEPWTLLNSLNRAMLNYFIRTLEIETPIVYASDLNVPGEATTRLVNLIRAVGGDTYYSGAHAVDTYLDLREMTAAQISVEPQSWTAPVYPQRFEGFVPDLSIIDCIMHCGDDALDTILGVNT